MRAEREVRIDFPQPLKLPNSLLRLDHVDCGYRAAGADTITILHDVNFGLESGDRIGLLGVNGAGKSTLVKTLVGDLAPLTGERNAHPDLRIGYFAQHTVESLKSGTSAIDHLRDLAPNGSTQAFRDFLGKWNFAGDRAFESINGFSGGERARLALALIAWLQPNVLLLDEPTNHLDLEMREALAEALSVFEGAIVMVSHDRHLIGLVCETFWRVHDGVVEPFDGDLDQYAAWLRSRSGSDAAKIDKPAKAVPAAIALAPPPSRPTASTRTSWRKPRRASPTWKHGSRRTRPDWPTPRCTPMAAPAHRRWAAARRTARPARCGGAGIARLVRNQRGLTAAWLESRGAGLTLGAGFLPQINAMRSTPSPAPPAATTSIACRNCPTRPGRLSALRADEVKRQLTAPSFRLSAAVGMRPTSRRRATRSAT